MKNQNRMVALLAVLLLLAGLYLYQNNGAIPTASVSTVINEDRSGSLPFDVETRSDVRHYFDGISVDAKENNLNEAIRLDHSVGRPQILQGKYKDAYRTYRKVLAISYRQGSLMGIGIALTNLATVFEQSKRSPEAVRAGLLAYKMAELMNNKEEIGVAELSLARRLSQNEPGLSVMWLLRARKDLQGTRYKNDYVGLLQDLAIGLRNIADDKRASATFDEAWQAAQSLGNAPGEKQVKWEVGIHYAEDLMRRKQYQPAGDVLKNTEAFFTEGERRSTFYTQVLYRLGKVNAALNRDAEAKRYYLAAYARYELARAEAPGEDARASLDNASKDLVDSYVDQYIRSKDYAAALAILESNKARTLNDILHDPAYPEAQKQWQELEHHHAGEIYELVDKLEHNPSPYKDDLMTGFVGLLKKQQGERRKLQTKLQLQDIAVTRAVSREQIEQLKTGIPPDVAMLAFSLSREQSSIFLLTRNRIDHIRLPLDAEAYRRAAQKLRLALANPHTDFYREPAQMLYKTLLQPALQALPASVKIIVYSPDGILSRIPLAALMTGDQFIAERFAFYGTPSLRYVLSTAAVKASPARNGIVCVDPDIQNARLPFQSEAGELLKKSYGVNVVLFAGKECSASKLTAALKTNSQPSFLHVGAHGNFYPADAMESAIWLSGDNGTAARPQPWNARAIATANMGSVELVTLSSCEAGLTDPALERDVFGIARALFFAGAKKIIAPLWAIDDRATAEFMHVFYQAYADKAPAVLALQQAQKKMIKTEKYRHPFYWSAFVLTGGA